MKAIILAAGYGTRLYPLTEDFPKPLLEINDKPLISYTLKKLVAIDGLKDIFVISNDRFYWKLEKWAKSCREAYKNINIKILNDGTTSPRDRLGAVGDINFFAERGLAADEDLLVIGGDNIFDFDLKGFVNFAKEKKPAVTVGMFDINNKEEATKYGVLSVDNDKRIVDFEEKPQKPKSSLIAMCLYYLPNKTIDLVNEYINETGKSDTTGGYISWLYKKITVYGFVFKGGWDDIGSFESLCKLDDGYCKFTKEDES